jgi:hypothetical protein
MVREEDADLPGSLASLPVGTWRPTMDLTKINTQYFSNELSLLETTSQALDMVCHQVPAAGFGGKAHCDIDRNANHSLYSVFAKALETEETPQTISVFALLYNAPSLRQDYIRDRPGKQCSEDLYRQQKLPGWSLGLLFGHSRSARERRFYQFFIHRHIFV